VGALLALQSLALAVPSFLIGVILVFIFGVNLSLLPTGGYIPIWEDFGESIRHLILPIATMSFFFSGLLTRFLKSSLLSERSAEYVDTARSKGVPKKRIWRNHILRNALLPGITVFGLYVGTLFAGAVITESIFNFPGVGRMLLDAVRARDYPVMQGTILLVVVLFVVVNLLVDLLYAILDPRIRYSK
jgi:peptide/nickel transport system permease protein